MQVGLKQVLKLQQSLVMTPQLKMAIKLLTLNHLELRDAVAQELVDNPVLDEAFDDPESNAASRERETTPEQVADRQETVAADAKEVTLEKQQQSDNTPEIDWEAYAESYSYLPPGAGSGRDNAFDDLPGYDQTLTRAETLEEHLLWQVRMSDLNPLEREIAARLIGEMNDDGFLDASPIVRPPARVGDPPPPPARGEDDELLPEELADDPALLADVLGGDDLLGDDEEGPIGLLGDGSGEGRAVVENGSANGHTALRPDRYPESGNGAHGTHDHGHADGHGNGESGHGLLMDGPPPDSGNGDGALLADGPAPSGPLDPVLMVAEDLEVPEEWVENVRRRVMTFDPVGCLARNLQECLVVQLELWGYDDECLAYNLVHDFMDEVENRNFQAIAKALKVPMADIGDAMKIIEALEPRPARNYLPQGVSADQQYITPDVYVHKIGDEYVINLNEDGLPKLKVSQFYLDKLKSAERGDPSKSYIKEKMRSATWLIRSIHQRQRTIYKVVESILKFQRDWFEGTGPLRPLILKEVADDIEMHESTVSRVTSRKYLHCHRGIFELKYFFNSSIATKDGSSIASESVKDEIKRIVADEDAKKPWSDAAIVKLLKDRNIDIARRTVAKYREMLGILPSNKRKQVF